tara:strand:+ start:259 stop:1125 length:867 start_codon:yes stop_codon:yes gene_type:complete
MNQLNLFIELTRLKKPIGYLLLFWPCVWGLTLVYDFNDSLNIYFYYLLLFFLGSVLMRSAGCIVNDILDRKFDKKVTRTKNRPIASGKVSVQTGLLYTFILCLLAFLVLINFNYFTILIALASMPFAFTYPLMKRFTYWPQLFLGVTFNYGLILGWTSISDQIDIVPLIFYLGAIFWTLGYDTIYGFQDINDDEIIGVKSTSIKFKGSAKIFIIICYLSLFFSLLVGGLIMNFNLIYFLFLVIPVTHLFYYQVNNFNSKNPNSCFKIFKSNNYLGIIVFCNILIGKLF